MQKVEFNSATKSKETRNKILGRENILAWDNLSKFNPYFWQTYLSEPKVGIKLLNYLIPECSLVSKSLFPYFL